MNLVSQELKIKIFYEYVKTRKPIGTIANEYNITFEEVIKALEDIKEEQLNEVTEIIDKYLKGEANYTSRVEKFIKKKKKPRENPTIEEQYGEIIYKLRKENAMSYKQIRDLLEEKYGLNTSANIIYVVSNKVFFKKGEEDPLLKKQSSDVYDYMIYTLREYGLSYETIARILYKRGKNITAPSVRKRCITMYESRNERVPTIRYKISKVDTDIYNLKGQGLDNEEIARRLNIEGIKDEEIEQRYNKMETYKKKDFAKIIIDFMVERKMTVKQMKKIAESYGIDLENSLNSLEER